MNRQKGQRHQHIIVRSPTKTCWRTSIFCSQDLMQTFPGPVLATSVSVSPYEPRLVKSMVHVLLMSLIPLTPAILPSHAEFLDLILKFDRESLYLFTLAGKESLSDEDQGRQHPEYHWGNFHWLFLSLSLFLSYQSLFGWP